MRAINKVLAGLAATAVVCGLAFGAVQAQGPSPKSVIAQTAEALGGAAKIRATKTIVANGYGMYAYQMGGGNITAIPTAPQKFNAANDLRRYYDLENHRYRAFERRNYLFTFAASNGHDFVPVNQNLDGDIAFDISPEGKAQRVGRWLGGSQHDDGIHMRRVWMHLNPVVLIHDALDPATKLSNVRKEGARTVVDVQLKEGDKLTLGLDPDHLPAFVRWANPRDNLGQVTFTTWFTGYTDTDGLMMPLGYDTRMDWRNIDYFKLYIDAYDVNKAGFPDLAAPAPVRATPEPPEQPINVTAFPIAKGLWRLTPGGTTVIEFKDHLTIFEVAFNQRTTKAVIAFANTLVPGKRVTQLIVSHNHTDHVAGVRQAIAEGLTVISRRNNRVIFAEMAAQRAADFPDDQERNRRPLNFIPVDEHLKLSDPTRTVDLYWTRNNSHMADALFAYVPAEKLMIEADIGTAAYDYQWWPDNFQDLIDYYHLDVQRDSPVHTISPTNKNVLSYAEVIDLIKGGVQRARARCTMEIARGNYFAGCPLQSKRY